METRTIVGFVIWALYIVIFTLFGDRVCLVGKEFKNPIIRLLIAPFVFALFGVIVWAVSRIIMLVADVIVSPILYFL